MSYSSSSWRNGGKKNIDALAIPGYLLHKKLRNVMALKFGKSDIIVSFMIRVKRLGFLLF